MDLLNYEDEMICPVCNGVGRVEKRKDDEPSINYICKSEVITVAGLSIQELENIIMKCFEMHEKRKAEISEIEYQKLTGGKVPKEW